MFLIILKGAATVLPNNFATATVIPNKDLDKTEIPNFTANNAPPAMARFLIILFLISTNLSLFPSPSALIYSMT